MGSGKVHLYWVAVVKPGRVMFESAECQKKLRKL